MADTRTEHLNLIKQDPEAVPDYLDDHSNLEILDEEVWKRGKAFNGQPVGDDGGFHIRNVPYAENLETSSSQSSDAAFIIRTTGGDASLMDGDAWLTLIKGTMTHTGYVPQSITMTVTPMARPTPPEITATLNKETFIAYVQQPGEYTISYTTSWSESPATYGITVSNDPVNGDSITVDWDGENDPVMTVDAVPRQAPEGIAAVIDDSVFVAYVQQSGTTTLTYGTGWSADPSLYGITVTGTPIAGDVITVVYVKEVRGTIIQSTPETFVSTGWNLYNHTAGYARVIKYSTEYNFKISGAYTALEFASTPSGTRTTITPVSGAFSIPSDGYIIVTGGNATTTAIWMTWSDWGSGYNWDGTQQGDFAPYSESIIDFGTFMATNFPYGLMQVGTAQDEINFNIGVATSKVLRLAYNDTNLATAKASGRQYEYDENYIYLERETFVTYSIEVDGGYAAFDHGLEYFTGTEQAVYAQTLYGQNLKNKLERDVLTISQQTLTSGQEAQVRTNIGLDDLLIVNLGSEIPDNSDLDDYKTYGVYRTQNSTHTATLSNVPQTNAGIKLIVLPITMSTYLLQVCIMNNTNPPIYMRSYRNGTWSNWTKSILGTDVANNLTTTTEGYVLDARKGAELKSNIEAISKYDSLGSFGTQAALDTALTTFNNGLETQTKSVARFTATAAFGLFNSGASYFVELSKGGTGTYSDAILMPVGGNTTIRAYKDGTGWTYSLVAEDSRTIGYRMTLAANTNLDNIKDVGMYYLASGTTYQSKPNADVYMLVVFRPSSTSNTPLQMAFGVRKVYTRIGSSTSGTGWNAWHSIDNYGEGWLDAEIDFDDVTVPGTYGIGTGNNPHGPGASGVLEVIAPSNNENYVIQRLISSNFMYTRYRSGSSGTTWGNWYKYTASSV